MLFLNMVCLTMGLAYVYPRAYSLELVKVSSDIIAAAELNF
jgi:hypothetical protein